MLLWFQIMLMHHQSMVSGFRWYYLFLTFSVFNWLPTRKKNTLHGGQSRSLVVCWTGEKIKGKRRTTGYTLVKTRHSRLPTYLKRETDTDDWSTPTFTLLCPKNGGVYPVTSTFLQNCTPIFRNVPWPGGKWDPSIGYFLRTNHFSLPAKDTKTQIFLL